MSLGHEVRQNFRDLEGDEEDDFMALSREQQEQLFNDIHFIRNGWANMTENVGRALQNDERQERRQEKLEGRIYHLEQAGSSQHVRRDDPPELESFIKTENHEHVKVPIARAGRMLDAEKNESELKAQAETLKTIVRRYQWWAGTSKEMLAGFGKVFFKVAATLASGWILKMAYDFWKSH